MPSTGGAFRCLTTSLALTATLVSPLSSSIAQSGGTVLGNVLDENDQAVPGARITITPLNTDGAAVEFDAGLDGQFSRSDIDAGFYTISALHETLGSEEYRIRVRPGHTVEARLVLQPGVRSAVFARANDSEAFNKTFAAGVAANRDGSYRDAARYFEQAAELNARCIECRYNAGVAYTTLREWVDAERAFQAALSLNNDYAAAYYGLSMVYVQSGRSDEAAAARSAAHRLVLTSLAARRQRAADDVARGITFYDALAFSDARRLFERAIAENQSYAAAHYWIGMTHANVGDSALAASALRRYLVLEADGEYADNARATLADLEQ